MLENLDSDDLRIAKDFTVLMTDLAAKLRMMLSPATLYQLEPAEALATIEDTAELLEVLSTSVAMSVDVELITRPPQ